MNKQYVWPVVVSNDGEIAQVHVKYTTVDGSPSTGVALRLHFNSKELEYMGCVNQGLGGMKFGPELRSDNGVDFDADKDTDKYVFLGFANIVGDFPTANGIPEQTVVLGVFKFKKLSESPSRVSVTIKEAAPGFVGRGGSTVVE